MTQESSWTPSSVGHESRVGSEINRAGPKVVLGTQRYKDRSEVCLVRNSAKGSGSVCWMDVSSSLEQSQWRGNI